MKKLIVSIILSFGLCGNLVAEDVHVLGNIFLVLNVKNENYNLVSSKIHETIKTHNQNIYKDLQVSEEEASLQNLRFVSATISSVDNSIDHIFHNLLVVENKEYACWLTVSLKTSKRTGTSRAPELLNTDAKIECDKIND